MIYKVKYLYLYIVNFSYSQSLASYFSEFTVINFIKYLNVK